MSSQEEHEARSLDILGKPWTEIHAWLDQYFDECPGSAHRVILHHRPGLELGVSRFGEAALPVLELHLMDDFGFIPRSPEEVARMMSDQGLLSFQQVEILERILDRRWPGRKISLRGLGA